MSLRRRRIYWVVPPAVVLMSLCALKTSSAQQGTDESTYIGSKACLSCHADAAKPFPRTAHRVLFLEDEPGEKNGCEACHGPGSGHLEEPGENIIKFSEAAPQETIKACQTCHFGGIQAKFRNSRHAKNDLACTSCHNPHSTSKTLLRQSQPEACIECHREKKRTLAMPSRHPVNEGKVNCSDCHDPHDNSRTAMKNVKNACLGCHQEKAGPFLYEHRAVQENCTNCHLPHGSVNQNLLKFRTPALCLQCHSDAPVFHDFTQANYRKCSNCHEAIHGSNISEKLLQ
ncbi:MAG: DmsE family decaheme c-type cytochrome [bacterium]